MDDAPSEPGTGFFESLLKRSQNTTSAPSPLPASIEQHTSANMLFSVSRASVGSPRDFLDTIPSVGSLAIDWLVDPVLTLFRSPQSARQAVAAVSRLAGRNVIQTRTFLAPTVSRRGTFAKFMGLFVVSF